MADNSSTDNQEDKTKSFKLILSKNVSDNINSHKVGIVTVSEDNPMSLYIEYKVSGLNSETTTEEINVSYDEDEQKQTFLYNNNVKFTSGVTIPELNADNSVVLNDYDATKLLELMTLIFDQTKKVNEQKLTEAGPNSIMYKVIPNSMPTNENIIVTPNSSDNDQMVTQYQGQEENLEQNEEQNQEQNQNLGLNSGLVTRRTTTQQDNQ